LFWLYCGIKPLVNMATYEEPSDRLNPNLIVKSNKLVNARLNNLTLSQYRFFEILVAQLSKEQPEFDKQRVYLRDFVEAVGTRNKNEYQRAREITKSLMKHVIEIFEGPKIIQVNLFHEIIYDKDLPYIEAVFHPRLKPYLLQLKEKFTAYDIRNTLPLSSVYAMQLYQLLRQYAPIGHRVFQLDELKRILGVEDLYDRFFDFKKRILLPSQKDLKKHCDITFTFKEVKKGRKIESIRFNIHMKEKSLATLKESRDEAVSTLDKDLLEGLKAFGLSADAIQKTVKEHEQEKLQQLFRYTRHKFRLGEVKNPGAYLLKLLEEGATVVAKDKPAKSGKVQISGKISAMKLLERLQAEFEEVRKQQAEEVLAKAGKEELHDFEEYVKANPYLRSTLLKNGELQYQSNQFAFWFGSFLLPDFNTSFISWAAHEKGITIKQVDDQLHVKEAEVIQEEGH